VPSTFPPPAASVAQVSRDTQLINIRRTQPYEVTLDDLSLQVDKDVFPPDLGFTSRYLAQTLATYTPRAALDMGCGSGYLALITRKRGTPVVWALDVHQPAVDCSRTNADRNGLPDVRVEQSDLFSAIDEGVSFDLIVFNQPYYPSTHEVIFGLGFDGGREIIERFLTEVPPYLAKDGVLIMPFSDMAGPEHNPEPIVKEHGYSSREVFRTHDGTFTHMIYEFKKNA
jgi:release factor glutamine methyltransferase